ncbi:MAG TPA: PspC domain-containing protein [Anaerolineae bacterium]|nr:PspC domain-containing protein [Anaerolineae bacterium]HNU06060.1 PspC domain-containing protein [Anaerolineae bacterium]
MTDQDQPIIDSTAREIPTKKRLYRSTTDRAVAGVAGGLGEFFGVDPGLVRVIWLILSILTLGIALLIYALAAWILPKEPPEYAAIKITPQGNLWPRLKSNPMVLWGGLLLLVGVVLLLNNVGLLPWRIDALWRGLMSVVGPALLIGLGVYLVLVFLGRAPDLRRVARAGGDLRRAGHSLPLRRSRRDRQLAGVCGGIAAYWDIDSLVVRMAWVVLSILTGGVLGAAVYAAAVFLVPLSDE